MYDVRRLRLLLELQRRGTLSAVASALSYSPSSISEQLSQLEAEVGVRLFERVGRRVRLTPQADILAAHAEIVMRQLEAAESALAQSLNEVSGRVRIAAFQTALLGLVRPVLKPLSEQYPAIRIEVFQAEPQLGLPRLTTHEYDLVIAEDFPFQPVPRLDGIDYQDLLHDPMRFVLPIVDASDAVGVWDLVADRPWAIEPVGTKSRDWVLALCRAQGFEPDIRFTTDDLIIQQRLVADGHAVAILPELLGTRGDPQLATMDIPGGPHCRRILTATRSDAAAHPAVEALRAALADHVNRVSRSGDSSTS